MTAKSNHSTPTKIGPAPLVLFGLDSRGKSKAARFGKEHADLAIKAASQLALQVLACQDPELAEIAARLPVGRVHATGRTFVPFIRRDLYDKLLAAAGNGNLAQPPATAGQRSERQRCRVAATGVISPSCRAIGRRSASGIWSSFRKSGGRLVRGHRRRSYWRHVHVALARLAPGTPVCAPSAAARLALSGAPTERRDQQIGESFRPGKARQNRRDRSGC